MAIRTLIIPWTTIVVTSTTGKFFCGTAFVDANAAKQARMTYECEVIFGLPKVKPAYQQANAENDPEPYDTFGDPRTTNGMQYPDSWDTLTGSAAAQLTRFGLEGSTDSGSDIAVMRVCAKIEISD